VPATVEGCTFAKTVSVPETPPGREPPVGMQVTSVFPVTVQFRDVAPAAIVNVNGDAGGCAAGT
ncbi:MAG: hypothetical protein KAX84_13130, partial [Burkholderiales bacterium]|nr:hypothetical protein [Burkholderiales bacterium]